MSFSFSVVRALITRPSGPKIAELPLLSVPIYMLMLACLRVAGVGKLRDV